jgi:hydrogenase/urease accessory protein HupE
MKRPIPELRLLLAVLIGCWFVRPAHAHDPGLSSLQFELGENELKATATFARADVDALGGVQRLEDVLAESILVLFGTNRIPPVVGAIDLNEVDAICHLSFPGTPTGSVTIDSALLKLLPRGHRQLVSIQTPKHRVLREQLFDASRHRFVVPLDDGTKAGGHSNAFVQFLWMGIEHIATGFDHLVFLLGLLIVSAGFRDVLKVVTAFTIAHSITLALAALEIIRISSRVVEPLIAVSIIYVGIENLVQRRFDRRWMLAFAFGLVHGCGFASALTEAGLGSRASGIAVPLFSFNLGVETGQVAIASILLPAIWRLKKSPERSEKWVAVCSVLISLAGAGWLVARTLFA